MKESLFVLRSDHFWSVSISINLFGIEIDLVPDPIWRSRSYRTADRLARFELLGQNFIFI